MAVSRAKRGTGNKTNKYGGGREMGASADADVFTGV